MNVNLKKQCYLFSHFILFLLRWREFWCLFYCVIQNELLNGCPEIQYRMLLCFCFWLFPSPQTCIFCIVEFCLNSVFENGLCAHGVFSLMYNSWRAYFLSWALWRLFSSSCLALKPWEQLAINTLWIALLELFLLIFFIAWKQFISSSWDMFTWCLHTVQSLEACYALKGWYWKWYWFSWQKTFIFMYFFLVKASS